MSKKAFFIFTLFILIVLGAFGWYFFMGTGTIPAPEDTGATQNENLFPFGEGSPEIVNEAPVIETIGEINETTGLPRLRQISTVPTVGVVAFDVASTTLIRFVERATGHIFETQSDKPEVRKISNVTIPKVYEVLWTSDGSKLIFRYLKEGELIKTFYAKISTTTNPEEAIEGSFLSDDIKDITLLGPKVYYTLENAGGSNGITANLDGSGKTSVFTSSFGDWTSKWTAQNGITFFSKPSGLSLGAAYILNPANGNYTKISADQKGLTALANSDSSLALISSSSGTGIKTSVFDVKNSSTQSLGVSTLTDKCVWSRKDKNIVFCAVPILPFNANYPDDWYKGKVSFSDSIWRIDAVTGETEEIVNPFFESDTPMDMIDLGLNQSETVLVFKNKKDQFVWRYEMTR